MLISLGFTYNIFWHLPCMLYCRIGKQEKQMNTEVKPDIIEQERLAAIDEIVVTVNHKINNPLTTIINYAELLQLMVKTEDQTHVVQGIRRILDAALKIKEVTHNLSSMEKANKVQYLDDIAMIGLPEDN